MNLHFDLHYAEGYKSPSQQIRSLTEHWVKQNLYCPICGRPIISQYENNRPVADFFCEDCRADFELKSKDSPSGKLGNKITDGAYATMIERITSAQNPNFFFLTYSNYAVNNFILIPNHFFVPDLIEKRKPLAETARRAGWVGCNINIEKIPESGKIFIIKDSQEIDKGQVLANYQRIKGLKTDNIDKRGWIMDVLHCVGRIPTDDFNIQQVYAFANELCKKHPDNNFVEAKIRQQLQLLRDQGFIEFTTRGNYRKIK